MIEIDAGLDSPTLFVATNATLYVIPGTRVGISRYVVVGAMLEYRTPFIYIL